MGSIPKKDIYHIYELEARDFDTSPRDFFWKNVFQAGGVFVFMVFVVFLMINFRFISSQIIDVNKIQSYEVSDESSLKEGILEDNRDYLISGDDIDEDGLSNELELAIGTNSNDSDTDNDGFNDFQEISQGIDPLGDGKIRVEINLSGDEVLPVNWEENNFNDSNSGEFLVKKGDKNSLFIKSFLIPAYVADDNSNESPNINLFFYLNNGKILKGVYREKTREISDNLDENISNYEIQVVSGWPKGTDWQRLIINAEIVELMLLNN